jgi:hypothetical protein
MAHLAIDENAKAAKGWSGWPERKQFARLTHDGHEEGA